MDWPNAPEADHVRYLYGLGNGVCEHCLALVNFQKLLSFPASINVFIGVTRGWIEDHLNCEPLPEHIKFNPEAVSVRCHACGDAKILGEKHDEPPAIYKLESIAADDRRFCKFVPKHSNCTARREPEDDHSDRGKPSPEVDEDADPGQ